MALPIVIRGRGLQLSKVFDSLYKALDYKNDALDIEEVIFENIGEAEHHLLSLEPGQVSLVLGDLSLLERFLIHAASYCARERKRVLFHSLWDAALTVPHILLEDEYCLPVFGRSEPALRLNPHERKRIERAANEFSTLDFKIDAVMELGSPDDIEALEYSFLERTEDDNIEETTCFVSSLVDPLDEENAPKELDSLDVTVFSLACLAKKYMVPMIIGAYADLKSEKPETMLSINLAKRFGVGAGQCLINEILRIENDRPLKKGVSVSCIAPCQ